MMARKPKNGQPIRFNVRDAVSGKAVRDQEGKPVQVTAYTAKAAKHQAKALNAGPVVVEPV